MEASPKTLIEFNYASFSLEPYSGSGSDATSAKLLKDIIKKLNDPDFPTDKRVKDRHAKRKGVAKRRLVHISCPFEQGGARCFGKIALIKNKAPMTWGGKDIIEEIENLQDKEFIDVTNYIINFNSGSAPVIMVEHNYSGPRISDIEYYFRQVSKEYKIAKSIKSILHLQIEYDQLDKALENVFQIEVKVNAGGEGKKANWLKNLVGLKTETGFRDVRLKLFYSRKKDQGGRFIKNIVGLDYVRDILGWLKKSSNNIEQVKGLKLKYQVEGDDEIKDLDFLKNKTTSAINIPTINKTRFKAQDFKHYSGQEFNYYLTTGKTHIEEHIKS